MSIHLFENVKKEIDQLDNNGTKIYGRIYEKEDVIHLVDIVQDRGLVEVGIITDKISVGSDNRLNLTKDKDGEVICRRYNKETDKMEILEVEEVFTETKIFERQQGILENDLLKDKNVVVIGNGTLGGNVAFTLARSGVGSMTLIDPDVLGVSNVCRHILDLEDLGRNKVDAIADKLRLRNPQIKIDTIVEDFNKIELEEVKKLFRGKDLIVCGADDIGAKMRINKICWELGVPSIYLDAYERAFGGDITYVVPEWETPCYECIFASMYDAIASAPRRTGVIDYTSVDNPNELRAEPGLGVDIENLTAIAGKISLALLVRDKMDLDIVQVLNPDMTQYIWGNKKEWIFEHPFQMIFAETRKNDDCKVCIETNKPSEKDLKTGDDIINRLQNNKKSIKYKRTEL